MISESDNCLRLFTQLMSLALNFARESAGLPLRQVEDGGGFGNAEIIAHISSKEINESSGLAVSQCQKDVFWTHNDGGGKRQVLYAMTRTGQPLGEFRITGAVLEDWEESFPGPFLYYPGRRYLPAPLRAFVDFVKANP